MEIALLGLRLVVGLAFAAHGAHKLFGAFGGGELGGVLSGRLAPDRDSGHGRRYAEQHAA